MDQSDLAGSKKYKGIQTKEFANLKRKQQISQLLNDEDLLNDPNLVRYNDKFLCKLCNTLHTNLTSFKRHINGKKHNQKVKIIQRKTNIEDKGIKKTTTKSTQIDKNKLKFINDLKKNLLSKHNVKNKNTDIHEIGSVIPFDKVSLEYTIDDMMDEKDTIGLLIKIDLSFDKNDKDMIFLKYLSKEEQVATAQDQTALNDVLIVYIINYKPLVIDIPRDMKLIFDKKEEFVKVNDIWYIQLRFVIT
ncbi:uncharacterized protein HGUI_03679 [Hanseniaspora guilliermondii]|uniref:U1-type domain-containing protein n=1 Tax=Hanseniaspora guilliermondii TaxID=56406 RepID=A0A1L0FPI1_9ASCO|nr:uncharacterized protein HGUI_03679 [Hanseniaspora guilliermondii]